LAALLLALHGALAGHALLRHNPTVDEPGHLLSGLYAWKQGDLTYYYVNPPLVKVLQTAPLAPLEWELPRQPERLLVTAADWVETHDAFLAANHARFFPWLRAARCVNVLLSLACGWLVYRWGREVFGPTAGLIALGLWAFCPNVLAWAGVCTADLGAAFFALAALYGLRAYLRQPASSTAAWAGLLLGLAQIAKFSLLVLYPVTLAVWLVAWWSPRQGDEPRQRPGWLQLVLLFLVSLLVINLGYGFQGSGRPLGSFFFKCRVLSGGGTDGWGNRFHDSCLEAVPVPLPAAYLLGLDEQKSHADHGIPAYLGGEWRDGGWWYYYLYALAVKLPLGTLLLGGLSVLLALRGRRYRAGMLEEGLLWLPPAALLVLVSSQTGINSHGRYALPALPFLFIGIGRVGLLLEEGWRVLRRWRARRAAGPVGRLQMVGEGPASAGLSAAVLFAAGVATAALGWNAVSVLRTHPHYLSYFNELAGGPEHGWAHLIDSNIDWGQDLLFLKEWVEDHPQARPLYLAYAAAVDPHYIGLDYRLAPFGPDTSTGQAHPVPSLNDIGLKPGWYAVSVNFLCGMAFYTHDENGRRIWVPGGAYRYFQHFQPVARAGYSIYIYHVTPEEIRRFTTRL